MNRDRATLVVSVHDVAPGTSEQTRRWVEHLDRLGIRSTLLVVPGPWRGPGLADDPSLAAWLRERTARGDEVAQHGWVHEPPDPGPAWRRAVDRAVCRGCGEFWSLAEGAARTRLQRGRQVLWATGLDPIGFTPPGWLASAASIQALRALGYRYTTSHRGVLDLVTGRTTAAFPLSNRPGSHVERAGAQLLRRAACRAADRGRLVRVALHPDDLASPALERSTVAALAEVLDRGAEAVPYAELVARMATSAGSPLDAPVPDRSRSRRHDGRDEAA
jgi:predicted deacetylase